MGDKFILVNGVFLHRKEVVIVGDAKKRENRV